MRIEDARLTFHEALEANVAEHPSKVFMSSHERSFSYGETLALARGIASYMRATGVGKGDRVAIILPRMPELVVAFLGCSMVGALPAPINYTLNRREIERSMRSCRPSLLIVHAKYLKAFDIASLDMPGLDVVVVGGEPGGYVSWGDACVPASEFKPAAVGFHDVAYLNYTTGSSGDPKGAIATHANIYWNTRASADAMAITGDDVHLIMFASFAHPHELFARPLYTGGSMVLLEEINPKAIARTIRDHGVTCMMGLAPLYGLMASHPAVSGIPMLRIAESGGMFSRPDIIEDFLGKFGIPVLSVWGSTETSGIAIANTPGSYRTDGSAGRACPHYEVRLLDDDGRDAPVGEEGELAFRGEGVVGGYFGDEPFNSRDGWYLSGDLARRDGEGFYYFIERKSGMLKVAGLKVYPLQVEIELMAHKGIAEVAVLGVEDKLRGVVPKAYIVPREGYDLDFDDIRKFCKGRMADYMIPRHAEFRDSLPKIGSGKIDKKALKETER